MSSPFESWVDSQCSARRAPDGSGLFAMAFCIHAQCAGIHTVPTQWPGTQTAGRGAGAAYTATGWGGGGGAATTTVAGEGGGATTTVDEGGGTATTVVPPVTVPPDTTVALCVPVVAVTVLDVTTTPCATLVALPA